MKTTVALSAVALVAFSGSIACAADLPAYETPMVSVPSFSWTGAYVGVNAGYAFGDHKIKTRGRDTQSVINISQGIRAPKLKIDADGFTVGGTLGYNYQFDSVVVGIETDFSYTDIDERSRYSSTPPVNQNGGPGTIRSSFRQELEYLGTVRGRVGYAFDRVLVFGTGGLAYGKVKTSARFLNGDNTGAAPGGPDAPSALGFSGDKSNWETGYAIGGGVEYAITDNITVKGEYLYYDLGSTKMNIDNTGVGGPTPGTQTGYRSKFDNDGQIVRAGLNYKF